MVFMEERLFSIKPSAGNVCTNSSFEYKLHVSGTTIKAVKELCLCNKPCNVCPNYG